MWHVDPSLNYQHQCPIFACTFRTFLCFTFHTRHAQTVRITTLEVFASNSGQGLKHTTMVQKQIDLPELGSVAALAWVGPKLIVATGTQT